MASLTKYKTQCVGEAGKGRVRMRQKKMEDYLVMLRDMKYGS